MKGGKGEKGICSLKSWPFAAIHRFTAIQAINGNSRLFTDLQPSLMADEGIKGESTNHLVKISLPDSYQS